MRSELINHLPISRDAKIFLRAVTERYIWSICSEINTVIDYTKGLNMNYIFVNSSLPFSIAYNGLTELISQNLVNINAHNKRDCDLNLPALLKFIRDNIKDEESEDYKYVSGLLGQMELTIN